MPHPIAVVDAFADRPFAGNPAGVCVLAGPAPEAWMRAVAGELNLAETAFLHPDAGAWRLRWFTPTVEVDLCGHATLAAAHHLWESGALPAGAPAVFHTKGGELRALRAGDGIELDFPTVPVAPCDPPPGLRAALGAEPVSVGAAGDDLFVELADAAAVRTLAPDLAAVARLPYRGVIVTAAPGPAGADFVSRFFGPAVGIPEDPVTGSAHCALGPYWAARLGRNPVAGFQASARGGTVRVTVRGPRVTVRGPRVTLAGRAVTAWRGELLHGPA